MVKRQMELSLVGASVRSRVAAKPDDARWWFARMHQAVDEAAITDELRDTSQGAMWFNQASRRTEPLGLTRKMVLV